VQQKGGRCRQMVIVKMSVLLSKQVSEMIAGVSHYTELVVNRFNCTVKPMNNQPYWDTK
jgi:hypothetical protein